MAYRWHPKNAVVDSDSPRAWGTCSRCGMQWNLDQLQWQYSYQGAFVPMNTYQLVCPKHLDPLNEQDQAYILPPDPAPIFNARPENYVLDEASWLATQDNDPITTQSDDPITTQIPSPSTAANTTNLVCSILAPSGSVSVAYLDLFDGNPTGGAARSVLAAITGSATRTDIASQLTTISGIAQNATAIVISSASESQTNINYVGIYSAASGGTLLMSGACSASPTIALGNPVQFPGLGLTINLN